MVTVMADTPIGVYPVFFFLSMAFRGFHWESHANTIGMEIMVVRNRVVGNRVVTLVDEALQAANGPKGTVSGQEKGRIGKGKAMAMAVLFALGLLAFKGEYGWHRHLFPDVACQRRLLRI